MHKFSLIRTSVSKLNSVNYFNIYDNCLCVFCINEIFILHFPDDRAKEAKAENWLTQFNFSLLTAPASTVKLLTFICRCTSCLTAKFWKWLNIVLM